MKSIFCVLLLFISSVYAVEESKKEKSILGLWKGHFGKKELSLNFKKDGTFTGIEKGKEFQGKYKVDFSVTPHHLDLIIDGNAGLSIFIFIDKNTIKMDEPEEKRRKQFRKETISLKREINSIKLP